MVSGDNCPSESALTVADAVGVIRRGGVVAYPTEAVWGLGCDPGNEAAVRRLLALKQRGVEKGLILVAASVAQLQAVVAWPALPPECTAAVLASWPGPHTWVVPATAGLPSWISGGHAGVAVRVSAHPVVTALCEAFGGPLVSTSANRGGMPPARTRDALDATLVAGLDGVVEGTTGALAQPTDIRDALSGRVLRG